MTALTATTPKMTAASTGSPSTRATPPDTSRMSTRGELSCRSSRTRGDVGATAGSTFGP